MNLSMVFHPTAPEALDSSHWNMSNITEIAASPISYYSIRRAYFFMMGFIIPFGLLCNTLALVVFAFTPSLRRTVTGHYLLALSVADTVFLVGDFIRWLNPTTKETYFGVDFMHEIDVICKLTHYLRYVGKFASAWLTVWIASQRFILVATPLKAAMFCTPIRVKKIIVATFIVSLCVNAYPFWTIGIVNYRQKTLCGYLVNGTYDAWNTAVSRYASLVIPGTIILLLTLVIVYDLIRAGKKRKISLVNCAQISVNVSMAMELHLSLMLVVVAVSFICLRLPYNIIYYINNYKKELWNPLHPRLAYQIYCAYKITDVVATLNYTINFFLYCLCGSTFRRHLINFLHYKKTLPRKLVMERGIGLTSRTSSKKTETVTYRFNTIKNPLGTTAT